MVGGGNAARPTDGYLGWYGFAVGVAVWEDGTAERTMAVPYGEEGEQYGDCGCFGVHCRRVMTVLCNI